MGGDLLDDFIRTNNERDLGVYGIHVHREGEPPIERRLRSDDRVNLYSVAKTFTSVALGLAEAEGRLALDDRLLDHFPELRTVAADGVEEVTLRQLVTMTSGTSHRWFADERTDAADLLHEIVAAPLAAAPQPASPTPIPARTRSGGSSRGPPAPTCVAISPPACSRPWICTTRPGTRAHVAFRSPPNASIPAPSRTAKG